MPLEQQHVRPAELREVVGDRGANYAAAGLAKVGFLLLSLYLMDRTGRRKLMNFSMAGIRWRSKPKKCAQETLKMF